MDPDLERDAVCGSGFIMGMGSVCTYLPVYKAKGKWKEEQDLRGAAVQEEAGQTGRFTDSVPPLPKSGWSCTSSVLLSAVPLQRQILGKDLFAVFADAP